MRWRAAFGVLGLGGLLPTAISMVSDYAPRGRAALTIGMLMTAHHAGGVLSAYVARWVVEPLGRRAAFWICVTPLLFVPVLAGLMPESLSFLVSFGGLRLVYGVATWLPTLMCSGGYELGFDIVGMLIAGCAADRFAPRASRPSGSR